MTRDDTIRMADAAGIPGWDDPKPLTQDMLERFAALVAAAERDACIIAVLNAPIKTHHQDTREACANAIRARNSK